MRILVLSDSHGQVDNMLRCVDLVAPDHILHLGDYIRDAQHLQRHFPAIPMTAVPGNCDWGHGEAAEKCIDLGGRRIFLLHGHTRGVKFDLRRLWYAARECGADVAVFGHTHRAMVDYDGRLYLMNPGSIGGVHAPVTYGVITIGPDLFDCSTYLLPGKEVL